MTDVMRLRVRSEEADQAFLPVLAATSIQIGDLLVWVIDNVAGNNVQPMASVAGQGSTRANQAYAAANFAGVAMQRHRGGTDPAGTIRVALDGVFEMPCASATFECGDKVSADVATGVLLSQQVIGVTDDCLKIGEVYQRVSVAATSVWVRLRSSVFSPKKGIKYLTQRFAVAAFTDDGSTSGHVDFSSALPAGALVLGWEAIVAAGFAGDTSAVVKLGISGSTGDFSATTSGSCFASGTVGSAPVAATAYKATSVTPRVTVTSATDFTSVVSNAAGDMTITIAYITF